MRRCGQGPPGLLDDDTASEVQQIQLGRPRAVHVFGIRASEFKREFWSGRRPITGSSTSPGGRSAFSPSYAAPSPTVEAHQPIPSRRERVPATVEAMGKELRIELDDEHYERLTRAARERHEDPTVYAERVLTQELNRGRFLEGSALFLSTPGVREEFAGRFGPKPGAAASAA